MYAAIRRFHTDGDMDEALRRADAEYTKAVECQLGFIEHRVVRTAPDEAISVLLFDTQAECDRNRFFSEQFIDIGFAGLEVELLDEWRGEVREHGRVATPSPV
jgi:heme-degrading monooxygenase HmoA